MTISYTLNADWLHVGLISFSVLQKRICWTESSWLIAFYLYATSLQGRWTKHVRLPVGTLPETVTSWGNLPFTWRLSRPLSIPPFLSPYRRDRPELIPTKVRPLLRWNLWHFVDVCVWRMLVWCMTSDEAIHIGVRSLWLNNSVNTGNSDVHMIYWGLRNKQNRTF